MLRLAGVLLSCGALCLALPVPPSAGTGCAASSLIREAISDVQALNSKGGSEITPQNNVIEAGRNITTYLKGFIEALKSGKKSSKEILLALKLQKIQDVRKSCLGWLEHDWEPVEEEGFFYNLEYLLRSLNHNAPLEETA